MGDTDKEEKLISKPIQLFLGLAFGFSWPFLFMAFGWFDSPGAILLRYLLSCMGMLMVALAAFIVRFYIEKSGFGDVGWNLDCSKWYLAIMLFGFSSWLLPSLIAYSLAILVPSSTFTADELLVALLSVCGFSVIAGFGEEFGWRGYLLARFSSDRRRAREGIVIIGFIWGVWHFPVALGPLLKAAFEGSQRFFSMIAPALAYCGQMIGITLLLSFIFGAVYLRTRSIMLVSIMHGYFIGFRDATGILFGVSILTIPFLVILLLGIWSISFQWLAAYEIGKEEATDLSI